MKASLFDFLLQFERSEGADACGGGCSHDGAGAAQHFSSPANDWKSVPIDALASAQRLRPSESVAAM